MTDNGNGYVEHDFQESLQRSHAAEDLPIWQSIYGKAFFGIVEIVNHRHDREQQRRGIDRSIRLDSGKVIFVDEKIRWRNRKTNRVYEDIALEYVSDRHRDIAGWVCAPILADYIAYAIAPLGICHLLPVLQLQQAWRTHNEEWKKKFICIEAHSRCGNRTWTTLSCCVPPNIVYPAIGSNLHITFEPIDGYERSHHVT
jgi:hypothetical protein